MIPCSQLPDFHIQITIHNSPFTPHAVIRAHPRSLAVYLPSLNPEPRTLNPHFLRSTFNLRHLRNLRITFVPLPFLPSAFCLLPTSVLRVLGVSAVKAVTLFLSS